MPVIILLGVVLLVAASAVLRGFVLSVLWGWFVVPLGVPDIGIAWSIGLAALISMITHQDVKTEDRELGVAIGIAIATPLMCLLFGWIAHSFM